jgi:hypothetical protein
MRWTTYIMGTLALVLGGGLLYLKEVAQVIPPEGTIPLYILTAVFLGGGLLLFLSMIFMSFTRPKFLYAFYPEGLAMFRNNQWGMVPWKMVAAFERQTPAPYLRLENGAEVPVQHDFPNGDDFYAEIERHVHEKIRLTTGAQPGRFKIPRFTQNAGLQLLTGVGLVAGAIGVAVYYWDWIVSKPQPHRTMPPEELVKFQPPSEPDWSRVYVDCSKVIRTNVEVVKTKNFVSVTESKIVLIPVQDRYLVANVRNDFAENAKVEGVLYVWKGGGHGRYANRMKAALDEVSVEFPQYKDKLLPYQFDATFPRQTTGRDVGLVLVLAAVVGVSFLSRGCWLASRGRPRVVV